MKVLAVTGIRSEYDILYPVLDELRKSKFDVSIFVSGAHLSNEHGDTYKQILSDDFEIADYSDTYLSTDRLTQRPKGISMIISGLCQTVDRIKPDFLLVVGDREESISVAIVGNYMDILVVHLGGGDPVFGNTDDPIRFAVSKLSHVHCCFSQEYKKNLINIGEESFRIFNTGNPSYVNISKVPNLSVDKLSKDLKIEFNNRPYIVMIKHPLSSELGEVLEQIETTLEAVCEFCETYDFHVVIIPPNTDPGSNNIRNIISKFSSLSRVHSLNTIPRKQFVNLIRGASALIGNSSMGILEAPFYKLPVVNVGNRQLGRLNAGNVEFTPYDKKIIVKALKKACLDKKYRRKVETLINPFGDESSAINIRKAMESIAPNDKKWLTKKRLC
jgi:GDP/UDP-N,N'-diacetylbacillosamine 2-epimerase (hydrolysing)